MKTDTEDLRDDSTLKHEDPVFTFAWVSSYSNGTVLIRPPKAEEASKRWTSWVECCKAQKEVTPAQPPPMIATRLASVGDMEANVCRE